MKKALLRTAVMFLAFASNLPAVTVATQSGTNPSTDAPDNGAPWGNVILTNGASGVYLGGGWVLTAAHVYDDQASPYVTYNSTQYYADLNEVYTLQNSSTAQLQGLSADADLVLFRLDTELSGLPTISLGDVTTNMNITMIGFGGGKTWGTNTVDPQNLASNFNVTDGNDFVGFQTDYDSGVSTEGQGIIGDSGGAAFAFVGGEWKLIGMMQAVDDAGNPTKTYFSSMSQYSSQINSIISNAGAIPEPSALLLSCPAFLLLLRRKR
ncbi:trypsin-like serine protease [Luteolibacter sp. AS25]|uniref:trypsin-like serine protease n=1 Tax=Luteolibacter sp. AS25 TaxID=3135776 RepID=UPI00398B0E74